MLTPKAPRLPFVSLFFIFYTIFTIFVNMARIPILSTAEPHGKDQSCLLGLLMADMCGSDHDRPGGAAGVFHPTPLLSGEHRPAAVPDRGGDAGEIKERLVNSYTAKRR